MRTFLRSDNPHYHEAQSRNEGPRSDDANSLTGNRLNQISAGSTLTYYAWDNNGNLLSEQTSGATTSYSWDARNRLRLVGNPDGTSASYLYSANGLRQQQQAPSPVTGTGNAATFVSQSVPPRMVAGQSYTVSVQMRNNGTNPWTAGANYQLGAQNPAGTPPGAPLWSTCPTPSRPEPRLPSRSPSPHPPRSAATTSSGRWCRTGRAGLATSRPTRR